MAGGRPTEYKPEFCKKVVDLGKKGYGRAELALALDASKNTLTAWGEKHPEFLTALNLAHDYSEAWWTNQSRENIDNKAFNAALFSINMQNRFGWNKKTEVSGSITMKHEEILKELE